MENSKRATLARALLASAGLCSIISLTNQAAAEEQQQQTAQPQQVAQADQAKTAPQEVETVTVTATRTAQDVEKVAVAVTAITAKQLEEQAPTTLQDLNGSIPNVFIGMNTAGPGASAIFIRGLGYADIEKTQTPSVGVVLDGVVFGTSTGQLLDTFDLNQVEVERGPQGIFFGQNTTAGVINATRTDPTREFGFKGSASYGSYGSTVLRGIFNAPLGEDGGIKLGGTWRYNYGDYYNVFDNTHAGGDRYMALNAVVDYDLTDWLNAKFSLDRIHEKGGGSPVEFGDPLTANVIGGGHPELVWPNYNPETGSPDGLGIRQIENNFKDSDTYDNSIYSLILNAQTPIGSLVSQTAYMDESDLVDQDFDGTCVTSPGVNPPGCNSAGNPLLGGGPLHTIRDQSYKQFTQEVRLNGGLWDNALQYLGGFFFYHHDIGLHQNSNTVVDQFSSESNTSWSFFGNLDWNVTDDIKLSGGFRTIEENKHFRTAYFVFGGVLIPTINDRNSWNHVLTRFAAQWQALPSTMLYASRSEGFRSGGFSIRGTLSEQQPASTNCAVIAGCPDNNFLSYNPETNVQYEIGAKNSFNNGSIVFNVAAFIIDDKGFQFSNVVTTGAYGPGTNTYISNLPKVESKGLEFELNVQPEQWVPDLAGLTLSASAGIQKAKIIDGVIDGRLAANPLDPSAQAGPPGSLADFTGQTLQRVPDYNYTFRGSYARQIWEGVMSLNVGWSYQASFVLGNFGPLEDVQPGYGLLDGQIGYAWDNFRVSLSGKNLTDTVYRDNSLPTVFFEGYGPGRTWMLQFDVNL
jgi:iron complex outermembrane receptor protein